MKINLPFAGIVLLIGPSNSGKSTFLAEQIALGNILPSEVVSSDTFRVLVGDEEFVDWKQRPNDEADVLYDQYQLTSREAFQLMDSLITRRAKLNKLTFVDATHLHPDDRKRYVTIAKEQHVPIVALILDVQEEQLLSRDDLRDHPRGKRRIRQQYQIFKKEKRYLKREGYASIYVVSEPSEVEIIRANTNPLFIDVGQGIDVMGDIHGCYKEMTALLEKLGYEVDEKGLYKHPSGRRFLSLGDIMSRGPESLKTIQFYIDHVKAGLAYMIDSNHGWKIGRWLDGKKVTLKYGDEDVDREFQQFEVQFGEARTQQWKKEVKEFLLSAPSHYVITKNGVPTLVCTHAGIRDDMVGKQSPDISDFCRYGDTDGLDANGKPIRKDWTIHHQTSMLMVWGHDPKPRPLTMNKTINIDQGVVFGGELTAFRYPEKVFVSVPAAKDYANVPDNPLHMFQRNRLKPPNIAKFINGFTTLTDEIGEVRVSKEYALPAIDLVSHHTIPMEELIYIPPTMSPAPAPSVLSDYLEHPREVIDYYRSMGIQRMVAEKKHMGSRGILFLMKDEEAGQKFVGRKTLGVIYTRTGRRFFEEEIEKELLIKINESLVSANYFEKYQTEFVLLDAEIMPWNLKAKELINSQYAHVAEQAILDRSLLVERLAQSVNEKPEVAAWLSDYEKKLEQAQTFRDVFQMYCWNVDGIDQIQIAPFHLLAHSRENFFDQPHTWHMERNQEFAKMSRVFVETEYMVIDNEASEERVIEWWETITNLGHEGIVIKPDHFVPTLKNKLIQPAIKVRGRKYLHIIYGMDYLEPDNLLRLKKRTTTKKQKLALREFALGLEGIRRYVNGESLERVHECVLATLAMEADPVDPRL